MPGRDYRTYPTVGRLASCEVCGKRHHNEDIERRCRDKAEERLSDWEERDDEKRARYREEEEKETLLLIYLDGKDCLLFYPDDHVLEMFARDVGF